MLMSEPTKASTTPTGKLTTLAGVALAAVSPVGLWFTDWAYSNPWLALPVGGLGGRSSS